MKTILIGDIVVLKGSSNYIKINDIYPLCGVNIINNYVAHDIDPKNIKSIYKRKMVMEVEQ
jgi:hypothetical protein